MKADIWIWSLLGEHIRISSVKGKVFHMLYLERRRRITNLIENGQQAFHLNLKLCLRSLALVRNTAEPSISASFKNTG